MLNPPRLLMIEDNQADVVLLKVALLEHSVSCEVEILDDGEKALRFLNNLDGSGDGARPNAIVLDLNLPKINGLEILRVVKRSPSLRGVRVAILTSSLSQRDRSTAEELGADLYLIKPVHLAEFLALGSTLKQLLTPQ